MKTPHALLTKGGHSDGFFNWSMIEQHPTVARDVCEDIFDRLFKTDYNLEEISRVVGPGSGAITLASRLAETFHPLNNEIRSGYTEKDDAGNQVLRRHDVRGQIVVPCEDTITSGETVQNTIQAIIHGGGIVADFILAVCNRSGKTEIDGRRIISLIDVPMNNWSPEVCPLCTNGSEAISPKRDNWRRFVH